MKRFIIIMVLALLMGAGRAEAVEVSARVDKRHLDPEDTVMLEVIIRDGHGEVDTSPIKDFQVMSQGTTTSVRIINSQMSREIKQSFLLIPLRQGRLRIPPLPVRSDNEVYKTDPIEIVVSDQPEKTARETPKLFVKAEVSQQYPFSGQQIIYKFKLFTSIQIYDAKFRAPDFEGFSAREMGNQKNYRTTIDSVDYLINEVSYLLVPLGSGDKTIKPAVLSCNVLTNRKLRTSTPFGSIFEDQFFNRGQRESKVFRTDAIDVKVRPLPEYQGPGEFSGLVGRFRIQTALEENNLKVGGSTTLSVTVSGEGNIMDAKMPAIDLPSQFKVYSDNPEENIKVNENGYTGKKIFRMALVPLEPGNYTLEPIRLNYFDVERGAYQSVAGRALALTATPSDKEDKLEVASAAPVNGENIGKKKVEFTGRDILPLKESLDAVKNVKTMSLAGFVLFLLIPALFCGAAAAAIRSTRKNMDPESVMAKKAETALKEAKKKGTASDEFLPLLHRALIWAVLAREGKMGESLTYVEAEDILLRNGFSMEKAREGAELLKRIESARFGGALHDPSILNALLSETESIIGSLS